jgi:hypothetical protein
MTLEKHLQAFQANVDLIDQKAESFHRNPTDAGALDADSHDSLGVMDAAVRSSFRQMRSDLEAVRLGGASDEKDDT